MANETTLEKPNVSLSEPLIDVSDLISDTSANGAELAEEGSYHSHWASVIGAFKDDPMLDAMMENIRQRRREIDADDNIP